MEKPIYKKQQNDIKITTKIQKRKGLIFLLKKFSRLHLTSIDDKRIHSIYLIRTYAYRTKKGLISKKEEVKCNNIIK